MITAQDIRERTFEKSKLGGYDMAEVDEFLEQLADELTASQKESSVLKSKMKVLVDKIEEYRGNENALNQALLAAQKLAAQIENEAKEKAASIIAEAEKTVREKLGNIDEQVVTEQKKLEEAKLSSTKFLEGMKAMCNAQLKNLEKITSDYSPVNAAAPKAAAAQTVEEKVEDTAAIFESKFAKETADIEEAVRSIEASVGKRQPGQRARFDLSGDLRGFPFADDKDSTQPFKI